MVYRLGPGSNDEFELRVTDAGIWCYRGGKAGELRLRREQIAGFTPLRRGLLILAEDPAKNITVPGKMAGLTELRRQLEGMGIPLREAVRAQQLPKTWKAAVRRGFIIGAAGLLGTMTGRRQVPRTAMDWAVDVVIALGVAVTFELEALWRRRRKSAGTAAA